MSASHSDDCEYLGGVVVSCKCPSDEINSPQHYTTGGLEAIDVIQAKLTPEEYIGYCKGAMLKYLMRANYKGAHDKDCEKARWYAERLAKAVREKASRSA